MIRDISIRYKIILMTMVIYAFISILSFTIFSINESQKQKKGLEREAILLARFTADYSTAPVVFGIKEESTEVLNNLKSTPDVISVAIYNSEGILFNSYNPFSTIISDTIEITDKQNSQIVDTYIDSLKTTNSSLLITMPIIYEGKQYGIVALNYSLQQAKLIVKRSMRTAALIILVFLAIVYLFTFFLQKIISAPILALASVSDKIKKEGNYKIRVNKRSNDEIGVLYDRFNNMLEHIEIQDNKRDQTETMLKDAKTHAENADKLKSAFLANMSHEIRTPMNSIIGFAGLLNESEITTEERSEYIELINSSCNTLLHLIDDILDISKIEAGQLSISIERYSVANLFHELFLAFKEINQQNNHNQVNLTLNISNALRNLYIETDITRLQQVLSNLISNAIKFTHNGEIEIGYSLVEKAKDNKRKRYVKFYVKDSGIGMDTDTQKIIFERFTKIESDNNKLYRGAGLGLTISKKIVELLHGEIWVESEVNKGSIFYFTLPALENSIYEEDAILHNELTANTFNENNFKEKNILIVEDEPSNYELLKAMLKKTEAKLSWSTNGIEAIEYCKQNTPDVILMDIKMPDMDGYETVKHLREMKVNVPIIAQTAFARIEDESMALNNGFNAYMSKPIEKNKLFNLLSEYFSK